MNGLVNVLDLTGSFFMIEVYESNVKKDQHLTGGVVGELLVREGARVRASNVLVRFDETQVRANLDIVPKAVDECAAPAKMPSATGRPALPCRTSQCQEDGRVTRR